MKIQILLCQSIIALTLTFASIINLPHHPSDLKRSNKDTQESYHILPFSFPPFEIDLGKQYLASFIV